MWEIKHVIPRALVTKTRGTYTVAPPDWQGTPVIARAGFRLSADQGDESQPDSRMRQMDRDVPGPRLRHQGRAAHPRPPSAISTSTGERSRRSFARSMERRPRPQEQADQRPRRRGAVRRRHRPLGDHRRVRGRPRPSRRFPQNTEPRHQNGAGLSRHAGVGRWASFPPRRQRQVSRQAADLWRGRSPWPPCTGFAACRASAAPQGVGRTWPPPTRISRRRSAA